MLKLKLNSVGKICLTLLGMGLLAQSVFAYEPNKVSYLDSVSTSYMYSQPNESKLLDINSIDARGIETTLKLDVDTKITNSNARVTISLRDSDIKQALRMLAQKAGINIVFDSSVKGRVTLDLNNTDINDAFRAIFKSCQLTYHKEGKTVTVLTQKASKEVAFQRQTMTVLPIRYVNAKNIAEFLNKNIFKSNIFGLSSNPVVTSNPRTNQIVIFGTPEDVLAVKRVLPVLDTKPLVNTFKVNHTTPKEMAKLICNSLFYTKEEVDEDEEEEEESSSSSDEDEIGSVVLGGGIVACRDKLEDSDSNDDEETASSSGEDGLGTSLAAFKDNPLTVTYFSQLGQIGIYGGSVDQVELIQEFIKKHDKKQLMAYVELSVIELNETGSKDFTNEWNLWTPFISLSFTPQDGLSTNSNSPFFIWGNHYSNTVNITDDSGNTTSEVQNVSRSNNHALVYRLRYLVENGNGRVLTNPKIMVTNGKTATIDMTSDYIKSVTSQVLESSTSITNATQKTYEIGDDEGLLIKIVPFISPDGYVSMNISPEFATIKERLYTKSESGEDEIAATLLQRRDLQLKNIRIKDGETLVLAGLIKESETQRVRKMPILSDLPFIGVFFRGNTSNKSREELVILVTPHIVKDNDDVANNIQNL